MKSARLQRKHAPSRRRELELLAQQHAVIIRFRRRSGGRQRALLQKIILRMIAVQRTANKPLRPGGLSPIDARRKKRLPERPQNRRRNRADCSHIRKKAVRRQLLQCVEFRKRVRAIRDAGIFVDVLVGRKKPQLARLDRPA